MRYRLALFCTLLLILARCGPGDAPALPPAVAPLAFAQTGAAVRFEKRTVRRVIEQAAQNVEALHSAPLYARLPAYVESMHVDIGDRVKKGQVLVELSVPELEAELKQKDAAVSQARAEATRAERALKAADANLNSASAAVREAEAGRGRADAELARAKSQHERLARAGRSGVIDRESVAETRYTFEAAKAGVGEVAAKVQSMKALRDESEARRDRAAADVEVAKARQQAAAAAREQSSATLGYRQVRAPFDGVVTQRGVDAGSFVQPASGASLGTPLLTVEHVDRLRVFVHLPEQESRWIDPKPGDGPKARVRGQGLGGRVLTGRVTRSAFALDPKTRTLRTEIAVDNPDRALRPGTFVVATIEVERADVWTLPASAIRRRDGEAWCFVNDGGTARRRRLILGLEGGDRVEVIRVEGKGGWAAPSGNEPVLADPGAALKDGDAVK